MCGIAGILGREDRRLAGRLGSTLGHRGPDAADTWSDAGVSLAHQRLSIVDLESGAQPMESHDGRYVIVYNGEVYNHAVLRRQLEQKGAIFRSDHSDTETILEGYRAWGPAVVTHLEGMFALAIWDTQERTLFVARDPFGVKPFFWAMADGDLVFASEIKGLLAHPDIEPVADLDRMKERAALEFLTGQATLFAGTYQLPPGTWALLRPGDARMDWQPYYHVPPEVFPSVDAAAHAIRDRFTQSVQEQLMADVPLGVILSGGLDSAAVAAVHQSSVEQPIHTFTIAESEEVEDFRQARRVAHHLGTEHHETFFDVEHVLAQMPRYTWHNENINYTEFFFLPLFDMMARHVKVGLCGQGSDELWGGYERYKDPLPLARERLARIRRAAPRHAEELSTQVQMAHMSGQSLAEWDQQGQLSNFQLRLVDRNSMAASLEVRVPFLSRPLHQASRAVAWGWKLAAEKPPADAPPVRSAASTPSAKPGASTPSAKPDGSTGPRAPATAAPRTPEGSNHGSRPAAAGKQGPGAQRTSGATQRQAAPLVEKWILRKALDGIDLPRDLVWRQKVPAGRATAPRVIGAFEAYAEKLVEPQKMMRDPMAATFGRPAEYLMYRLWHEVFIERNGYHGVSLEDLC